MTHGGFSMTPNEILDITTRTGYAIMTSGAEIYRAATTVDKVLNSFDHEGDSFVIASGLFITVRSKEKQTYTAVRAIKLRPTNLRKLEEINDFSRKFCEKQYSYVQADELLNRIEMSKYYNISLYLLSAFTISMLFCVFFGGNYIEGVVAGSVSMIVYFIQSKFFTKYFVLFFDYILASTIGSLICLQCHILFPELSLSNLIVGFIMSLVPGGTLTTGMKDALYGDVISSIYKFFDTVFIAFALGIGILIVLLLKDVFL
jgi:uncharacterized membrane protein YjjP (DUF1212 family)